MFTRKKEIQRKQAIIDSLNAQNQRLRIENAEQREEYDNAENAWLIKTNANLSSKLNIKRGADGRFVSTKKDHE